jgi:hypothetical protein
MGAPGPLSRRAAGFLSAFALHQQRVNVLLRRETARPGHGRAAFERSNDHAKPAAVAAIGFLHARFEAEQQEFGTAAVRVLGLAEGAGLQQVRGTLAARSLRGQVRGVDVDVDFCSGRTS